MADENIKSTTTVVPEEFDKVIRDFVRDIKTTFPEYVTFINKWWKSAEYFGHIEDETERLAAHELSLIHI